MGVSCEIERKLGFSSGWLGSDGRERADFGGELKKSILDLLIWNNFYIFDKFPCGDDVNTHILVRIGQILVLNKCS